MGGGQVRAPLYSLRYAGPGALPAEVITGAAVASVRRLTEYILPDELAVKGCVRTAHCAEHCTC